MSDLISKADMLSLADLLAGFHYEIDADLGDGSGAATTLSVRSIALGYAVYGDGSSEYGTGVPDLIYRTVQLVETLKTQTKTVGAMQTWFSSILAALDAHCRAKGSTVNSSIISLDTFLTHYNDATYGDALVSFRLAEMYQWVKGGAAGEILLDADNVWPAVTTLGDYNIGTSTFTDGDAITRANSGSTQGFAAPKAECEVTTQISGGDAIVTVTGTDRTGATGVTWTATIPNGSVVATKVNLAADTAADDRIANISNIAVATATGGAFDVNSKEERSVT